MKIKSIQKKFLLAGAALSAFVPCAFAAPPVSDSAATQEARFRQEKLEKREAAPEPQAAPAVEDRTPSAPEPPGSSTKIPVKAVHFLGNYSIPEAELQPLVRDLVGREATLSEIQGAVTRVKRYYREKGFVATYAYVPPQEVQDGTLSIDVIEGRLGELRIAGARYYDPAWIRRQFSARSGDVLTYGAIRKDLNRLNRHEDLRAKLALEAGKDVGSADAVVTVEDRYPVHLSMDLANSGTENTGLYRFGVAARHNNLTGRADSLSSSVQLGDGTGAYGAGYEMPVLESRTRIGYLFSRANVDIGGPFKSLGAEGHAETHSIYATRPFWESQSVSVAGTAGFDFKEVKNRLLGEPSGEDQLRILRLETDVVHEGDGNRTLASGGLYTGIPGVFGGSDSVDPYATRLGTGGKFFAARAQATHFRRIGEAVLLSVRGSGQASDDSLPPSEQFRLGGARSVRGYQESDTLTDYGAQVSVELFFPAGIIPPDWHAPDGQRLRDALQAFVFADGGWGSLKAPAAGENKRHSLAGLGAGLRMHVTDKFYARVEWGFPVGDEPTDGRTSAFYFTLSYEFF